MSGFLLQYVTVLLQNATVIANCDDFITRCDSYYKLRRLIQIATVQSPYLDVLQLENYKASAKHKCVLLQFDP